MENLNFLKGNNQERTYDVANSQRICGDSDVDTVGYVLPRNIFLFRSGVSFIEANECHACNVEITCDAEYICESKFGNIYVCTVVGESCQSGMRFCGGYSS